MLNVHAAGDVPSTLRHSRVIPCHGPGTRPQPERIAIADNRTDAGLAVASAAHAIKSWFLGAPRVGAAPVEDLTEPAVPASTSRDGRRCFWGVLARRGRLSIPARHQRVDALTYFSLNQTAASGGSLEFNGDALVTGTQVAQFVDSIQINL